MSDQVDFIIRNIPNLLVGFPGQRPGGLLLSVVLAISGIGLGFCVALAVGSATTSRWRVLRTVASGYIWLFRGVPLILLLLIVHNIFSTGKIGVETSSFQSALIALVLYSSAYQASIVAAGLRAVPAILVEDARLLGASARKAWQTVQLPYGLRVMRPALVSQAISLFKDTSVVVVLGVADLTTTARIALGSDIENAPYWVATYLTVGFLYFLVATALSQLATPASGPEQVGKSGLVSSLGTTI